MPRRLPLCLLLLAPLVQAEQPSPDLAYAIGAKLGERLRAEAPALELDELLAGLRQAYREQPLRLSAERLEELLAAHQASQLESTLEQARAAERRFIAREKARPGIQALDGGVLREVVRAGQGPSPGAHARVQVKYSGRLTDGSLFDESRTPQWFNLDSVIPGWGIALRQMSRGAHWRLLIPSAQAYGAEGAGDLIPPHAPLLFELELLDFAD